MARAPAAAKEVFPLSSESLLIGSILGVGLRKLDEARSAERVKEKGTSQKLNPYVTDSVKCQRAVGYSLLGEKQDGYSMDSLLAFKIGAAFEDALCEAFEAGGATVEREVRIEIPFNGQKISGRVDALVVIPGLMNSILELKTTNSRAMAMMLKRGEKGKSSHRHQLNLYLHAGQLGLLNRLPRESGYLVYCVKDSVKGEPSIRAWEVEYDEALALKDLDRLSTIAEAAQKGLLPGRPYATKTSSWECGYCDYKKSCWN